MILSSLLEKKLLCVINEVGKTEEVQPNSIPNRHYTCPKLTIEILEQVVKYVQS